MPTRWSPDTCDCILVVENNPAPPGQIYDFPDDHTLVQVVQRCPTHAALPDGATYAAVLEENLRKSRLWAIVESVAGVTTDAQRKELLDNFLWSWGPGRRLDVGLPTLTPAQRGQAQAQANAKFGPSKAKVV